jgi:N-acyl amino acid synthase of PEP-CTERM/exosortase system
VHKETIGHSSFTFKFVEEPDLMDQVYRLRFQVYCEECQFIKEEEYPDDREQDKYDQYALHFVVEDNFEVIGTMRLILDSSEGFPLEERCGNELQFDKTSVPRDKIAEISRLVISKDYRRRKDDGLYYTPEFDEKSLLGNSNNPFRRIRTMTFGMYRELYHESKRRGLTHWYALMEKSLWKLLDLNGFVFKPIGNEIDYYGMVTPYIGCIEEIERGFYEKYPQFFTKFFLDGLETQFHPEFLSSA